MVIFSNTSTNPYSICDIIFSYSFLTYRKIQYYLSHTPHTNYINQFIVHAVFLLVYIIIYLPIY